MHGIEGIVAINKARDLTEEAIQTPLPNGFTLFERPGSLVIGQGVVYPVYDHEKRVDLIWLKHGEWLCNNHLVADDNQVAELLNQYQVPDVATRLERLKGAA